MTKPLPKFPKDTTAAAMLDMPVATFRNLVAKGALPQPISIGDHERWDSDILFAIVRGEKVSMQGGFEL